MGSRGEREGGVGDGRGAAEEEEENSSGSMCPRWRCLCVYGCAGAKVRKLNVSLIGVGTLNTLRACMRCMCVRRRGGVALQVRFIGRWGCGGGERARSKG